MGWFKDIFPSSPEGYYCSHPNSAEKNFTANKAATFCLTVNGGRPCPFLVPTQAAEGRGDEMLIKPTKKNKRQFPGA